MVGGEISPNKTKTVTAVGKVIVSVFLWVSRDVLHIEYLEQNKAINGNLYAALLDL